MTKGCRICNILEGVDEDIREQVKEEICNDIAINHPEMYKRIREINTFFTEIPMDVLEYRAADHHKEQKK